MKCKYAHGKLLYVCWCKCKLCETTLPCESSVTSTTARELSHESFMGNTQRTGNHLAETSESNSYGELPTEPQGECSDQFNVVLVEAVSLHNPCKHWISREVELE